MSASLASTTDAILAEVFASLDLPAGFARSVPAARPDLADRQCNGAMAIAKSQGGDARKIAASIAGALTERPEFAEVSVAGPGFVNMRFSEAFLVEAASAQASHPGLGFGGAEGGRIVIDFGGPNIAKPLHVGHLRSLVIGECLRRLFSAYGHEVVSDVHLGDWGLQMGQLISELENPPAGASLFRPGMEKGLPQEAARHSCRS